MNNKSVLVTTVVVLVFGSAAFGQPWDGNGVDGDPYLIYTAADMRAIGADHRYWNAHFLMMADVNLGAYTATMYNIIGKGILESPSGIALDISAGKIYWTDSSTDKIQRANLDGTWVEDLVTTGLSSPDGIALDISVGKLYWTDSRKSKIQRANLNGTVIEDLITTGLSDPHGIFIDSGGGKMYWTDRGTGKIQRANLDGTGVEDLVTGLRSPRGIALESNGGKMYWTDSYYDKIQRANLDGTGVEDLVTTGLGDPSEIAVDSASGKMYWTNYGIDKIQRANLDGTEVDDLVTGLGSPYGIALDVAGGKIFWTEDDFSLPKICESNLDGSGISEVIRNSFTGVFDGDGHTISNFKYSPYELSYIGLFDCIGEQGIVKNLSVINATLISFNNYAGAFAPLAATNFGLVDSCHGSGIVKGSGCCAGLVAENYGLIANSSADCSIQGLGADSGVLGGLVGRNYGIIADSFANASVAAGRYHLGGLVGSNSNGSIYRCGASGSVAGVEGDYFHTPRWIGGLVGTNYRGRIEKSYADVSVFAENRAESVGGLVGSNTEAELFSCYSIGPVSVGSDSSRTGGLVGAAGTSGITNCYTASNVSAPNAIGDIGGLVGYDGDDRTMICMSYWDIESTGINYSDGGIGLTTEQMQDINTYHGWGDDTWTIDNGNDYPKLIFQNQPGTQIVDAPRLYAGGSGTEHSPYLIENAQQLNIISLYPADWQKHFELVSDLNLAETSDDFTPLGYGSGFTGVFDGNGYTIRNLTVDVNQASNSGLFALISYDGIVKNLNVDNFYINIGWPEYGGIAGALAATNKGTVKNCHSNGLVKAMYYVGGLIGVNWGEIFGSTFSGDLICRSFGGGLVGRNIGGTLWHSSSIVDIHNSNDALSVGGLVGYNQGSPILHCKSNGSLTVGEGSTSVGGLVGYNNNSLISHCYSVGSVTAGPNSIKIGGFAGANSYESIINSSSSGSVSAGDNSVYVGGLVGYNYAKVSNCYSNGNVIGTTNVGGLIGYSQGGEYAAGGGLIEHSYCTGLVIGDTNVGGLVGVVSDSNVVNAFWDVNSGGIETSAGGTGLPTVLMQTESTFTDAGWDFVDEVINGTDDIWDICEGTNYPKLVWSIPAGDFICPDGVDGGDVGVLCDQWLFYEVPDDIAPNGGDGIVNFFDWTVFADSWPVENNMFDLADFVDQWLKTGQNYLIADIAPDGGDRVVNLLDYATLADNYLTGL